jgi:D-alanyl-D-alanine carboxypeptidase
MRRILVGLVCSLSLLPAGALAGPALLFEASTGKVLYAEDADDQWHPASLTKVMTAYLAFEAIKSGKLALDTKIPCSETAHAQPPSKVGLPVGAEMTVELALKALIVKSANDVAVMLAEAVAGGEAEFVERMNATARRLGMTRTQFANANGLPVVSQVTTARDLARLSMAVMRDFPEYQHYWALGDVHIGRRRLGTHNGLLRTFEGADGLKTGFICDSGFNVVASATRDGRRLMAVVLGESSGYDRSLRAASLLEHGFQAYDWKALFNPNTVETLPQSGEAKDVVSVRANVVSWECGGRPRAVAKARAKTKKTAQKPSAEKGASSAASTGAPTPAAKKTSSVAPAPAPATASKPKPKAAQVQQPTPSAGAKPQ